MNQRFCLDVENLSKNSHTASKYVVDLLFDKIYPLTVRNRQKLQSYSGNLSEEDISKIHIVNLLCCSQIKKSLANLFEIFKLEHNKNAILQESRHCAFERLSWCINKLMSIEDLLHQGNSNEDNNHSILTTPIYFVNWIDHTFGILTNLATIIYKTDHTEQWKNDLFECVTELHTSTDELLLSAMTLCKYCLPSDQVIVKARCQVVLRETTTLLTELIDGDLNTNKTINSLKLPIMPSNVNVLIDVLKDVLYILETNTNTALLSLLVHCFSNSLSPVKTLWEHFKKGDCSCLTDDDDCHSVKEFDMFNERLLQIGSFAMSCSSDQNRILSLRSGLASLEALDPHLVPALSLSPDSLHASLLMDSWCKEVTEIRDSVFLIVDPAAFAEKSKHLIHQKLLDLTKLNFYNNNEICAIINIGCVVLDFFTVYNIQEPDALTHHEKLVPLLADLDKVQMECKIVSNLLCTNSDFQYEIKNVTNKKEVSISQMMKRLKLLYTLVTRINDLLHPKDDDQMFEDAEETDKNLTHTIHAKNALTHVNTELNFANLTRSIFARTVNIRSSTTNYPLSKLTKRFKHKQNTDMSFSVKLDQLFNSIDDDYKEDGNNFANKNLHSIREKSILYNFSPIKRPSLRKAVLNRQYKYSACKEQFDFADGTRAPEESCIDEALSLQITEVLNEMSDITSTLSTTKPGNTTHVLSTTNNENTKNAILKPDLNILKSNANQNVSISKRIRSIPVNASTVEVALDDSERNVSNITQPSNVSTLERINDIDLVENRLSRLRFLQMETSL